MPDAQYLVEFALLTLYLQQQDVRAGFSYHRALHWRDTGRELDIQGEAIILEIEHRLRGLWTHAGD